MRTKQEHGTPAMNRQATLPLAKVFQIKGFCDDCGHHIVMNRNQIARERIRWQIATPEELGSKLVCSPCQARGAKGKNISIRVIDGAGMVTPIRTDKRPLSAIDRIVASCQRCGYRIVMDRQALDEMPDVRNVDHLAQAATCMECREAGAADPSLTIEVEPPMLEAKSEPSKPKWSKATVFGEERSDPFYSLPRRRIAQ